MNWKRTLMGVALGLAACSSASAQQTNRPSRTDYAFFRIISERNIFNPNRYPHRAGTRPPEAARTAPADTFALVGTMSYAKGTLAFFDGSSTDYQQVLKRGGEIAGFTLTAIQPNAVVLTVGDKPVELKVGAQMRRDDEAGWQLVGETATAQVGRAEAPAPSPTAGEAGGDANEILKKLMQQREQELK